MNQATALERWRRDSDQVVIRFEEWLSRVRLPFIRVPAATDCCWNVAISLAIQSNRDRSGLRTICDLDSYRVPPRVACRAYADPDPEFVDGPAARDT